MYTGLLLSAFGLAIVLQKPLAIAAAVALTAFFNFKAREEERRLLRCYPEYATTSARQGGFFRAGVSRRLCVRGRYSQSVSNQAGTPR
jgi:hypothetical protein